MSKKNSIIDIILLIPFNQKGQPSTALDAERLRPLYEQHKDWVEDVDRQKIERALNLRTG